MTPNEFVPNNLSDFFEDPNTNALYQGDIIDAFSIGLKEQGDPEEFPNFYIIISKSCDVSFRSSEKKTLDGLINVLPLIPFPYLQKKLKSSLVEKVISPNAKIVFLPLASLIKAFASLKVDKIESLIKGQFSRFMYIPPDGKVLKEPMVVDFDLPNWIEGDDADKVKQALEGKKLQLASPFKEKLGQRYGIHFSSIGLNDDTIRDNNYIKKVKEHLKASKV